ncbi:MAG: hypothetical protein DMG92_18505 [Acidobacteria bacterium]|nr:MAG: hypothetical protein DMG92_18505 [Acidobacteriota bacterium]
MQGSQPPVPRLRFSRAAKFGDQSILRLLFDTYSKAGLRSLSLKSRFSNLALCACLALCFPRSFCACDASDDSDFPKSVALAKKTNRPLLLAFLGTDWSISSLKLDREVFDQAAFADDSKYNYLLCKLHFYQTQERSPELVRQNEDLAERYHIEQFPTVVVLSPDGREVGRLGYIPGGVDKFAGAVNKLLANSRSSSP